MRIKDILHTIEQLAPLSLQEGFDNSGLQVGDINQEASGVLFCLDVTEKVVEEALVLDCNLIISHHPLLFHSLKSLTGKSYIERCVMEAVRHDVVIYAAHTNLDNAMNGVNYKLAEMLGLQNVKVLSPAKDSLLKLVTFVPESHAEIVRNALFNAGAGNIGDYDSCSYNVHGEGTFKAGENANPFVGEIGCLHFEPEVRIETVLPKYKQKDVMRALVAIHPYEEPTFDFYPLANTWEQIGSGIVGSLSEPMLEQEFLYMLKDVFNLQCLKHSPFTGREIRDVALCGGSGAFLISDAIHYGADAFITGEAKYNDFFDVENKLLLAVIGHYESEICTKEILIDVISKKYPNFTVHLSVVDRNPVNYLYLPAVD